MGMVRPAAGQKGRGEEPNLTRGALLLSLFAYWVKNHGKILKLLVLIMNARQNSGIFPPHHPIPCYSALVWEKQSTIKFPPLI